jgi:hypothetical protein
MTANFDDIIFLLSTDCFCSEILATNLEREAVEIRKIARKSVSNIINGGDNYYLCADFSIHRTQKTESNFFEAAKKSNISEQTLKKIHSLHEILKSSTDEVLTASYVIGSIASRLYWLSTEEFSTPITLELLGLIAEIEPLGLDTEHNEYEWENIWLASKSEWDIYIMSLMDGIDEAPYLTFLKLRQNLARLDFIRKWRTHLGHEKLSHIRNFITTEAHHELDDLNAAAAEEIETLIDTL